MERTDSYGTWTSADGKAWVLTEPSPGWTQPDPPTDPSPVDDLDRVRALGIALLNDPEAFAALVDNVAPANTARPALEYIQSAVATAAETTGDQP